MGSNEIQDEGLKRRIIRRAIKTGRKRDGDFVRYAGHVFYVHIIDDKVKLCSERK